MNNLATVTTVDPQIVAIRNDIFRLTTHDIRITKGVWQLPDLNDLVEAVRYYSNFTEENDPYNTHDCGVLTFDGKEVWWRIDYFDPSMAMWCNPMSPDCRRVLTLLLSTEY